ncbi:MAG: hypothetical protein V3U52_01220 [Thermoplasmata archaeon]
MVENPQILTRCDGGIGEPTIFVTSFENVATDVDNVEKGDLIMLHCPACGECHSVEVLERIVERAGGAGCLN